MVHCEEWEKIFTDSSDSICLIVFPLEAGFAIDNLTLISEGDVLGDRLSRGRNLNKKARDFISDATKLMVGDLVVHTEHGVGRFQGLTTIETSSAPHDCQEIAIPQWFSSKSSAPDEVRQSLQHPTLFMQIFRTH